MKLIIIGSGSRGNSVVLQSAGNTLIVDAGFGARTLLQRLELCNQPVGNVVAIVLTHEHGDHVRGVGSLVRKFGCPVYGSAGTFRAIQGKFTDFEQITLSALKATRVGGFAITSCTTAHDAAEPISLAIEDQASCKVGIAHDIGRATAAMKYMLKGISCLVVESNYDEVMLRSGPYPPSVQQRIAGSSGHLSNRAAGALASDLCHPDLSYVVLAHLSERCNTPAKAHETVASTLKRRGFGGRVLVAGQTEPTGPLELFGPSPQLELEPV